MWTHLHPAQYDNQGMMLFEIKDDLHAYLLRQRNTSLPISTAACTKCCQGNGLIKIGWRNNSELLFMLKYV